MCELLGLCFNREVSFHLAFSGLKAGAWPFFCLKRAILGAKL